MPTTTQPEQPRKKKRRIRPLWIIIGSLVIMVLLLIVAAGGHRLYVQRQIEQELREIAARGEPVDADDLQADYALPADAVDRTEEWLQVLETIQVAAEDPAYKGLPIIDDGKVDSLPLTGEDWADEATIIRLMTELEPTFAKLDELRENAGEVRYPLENRNIMLHHRELRNLARMLSLRARWQVHRGESQGALESLLTIRRAADPLDMVLVSWHQMLRIACYGIMVNDTLQLLPYANWSESQLTRLQEEFLGDDEFQNTLHRSLLGDRVVVLEAFNSPKELEGVVPPMYEFTRPTDQLYCLQLFERMIAASELPYTESQAEFSAIETTLEEESESQLQSWRHTLTHLMVPMEFKYREVITNAKVRDRAAGILISCELYRLSNGSYPTQLDQLVPFYLDTIPTDPYDGQPLRYRVKPEEIIVYSVGENLVDDGGELSENPFEPGLDEIWRLKLVDE